MDDEKRRELAELIRSKYFTDGGPFSEDDPAPAFSVSYTAKADTPETAAVPLVNISVLLDGLSDACTIHAFKSFAARTGHSLDELAEWVKEDADRSDAFSEDYIGPVYEYVLAHLPAVVAAAVGRLFLEASELSLQHAYGRQADGAPVKVAARVVKPEADATRERLSHFGPRQRRAREARVTDTALVAALDKLGVANFDAKLIAPELGVTPSAVYKGAKRSNLGGLRKLKKGLKDGES